MGDNGGMNMPMKDDAAASARRPHFLRYILIGFFTVAPLWITWLVLDFLFSLLARLGAPFMWGAARLVRPFSETLAGWLLNPAVQYVLAALFAVAGLYGVGLLTSVVLGRRLIEWFERLLERLPLVQTDWSIEQAMSFVMTGGANAPDKVRFHAEAADPADAEKVSPGGTAA